jgi:hypothetical protein
MATSKDALGGALGWVYIPGTPAITPTSRTALRGTGSISISWCIYKLVIINISTTGFEKVGLNWLSLLTGESIQAILEFSNCKARVFFFGFFQGAGSTWSPPG